MGQGFPFILPGAMLVNSWLLGEPDRLSQTGKRIRYFLSPLDVDWALLCSRRPAGLTYLISNGSPVSSCHAFSCSAVRPSTAFCNKCLRNAASLRRADSKLLPAPSSRVCLLRWLNSSVSALILDFCSSVNRSAASTSLSEKALKPSFCSRICLKRLICSALRMPSIFFSTSSPLARIVSSSFRRSRNFSISERCFCRTSWITSLTFRSCSSLSLSSFCTLSLSSRKSRLSRSPPSGTGLDSAQASKVAAPRRAMAEARIPRKRMSLLRKSWWYPTATPPCYHKPVKAPRVSRHVDPGSRQTEKAGEREEFA